MVILGTFKLEESDSFDFEKYVNASGKIYIWIYSYLAQDYVSLLLACHI